MKTIFTLIEYLMSDINRCGDYTSSDLSICNWDERDYDTVAKAVADILYKQSIGEYRYSDFTLLINGIVVSYTDCSNVCDQLNIPLTEDGEISPEEIAHNEYVEEFWANVQSLSSEAKAAYDKEQEIKRAAKKKAQEERDRKIRKEAEEAERKQYEALKQKFGN